MRLSFIFELLLIFVFLAFAASRVIGKFSLLTLDSILQPRKIHNLALLAIAIVHNIFPERMSDYVQIVLSDATLLQANTLIRSEYVK